MKYPNQIISKKSRVAYFCFKHWYALDIGKNRIVGRPFAFLPEITIIIIALKYFGLFNPTKIQILFAVLVGMFIAWAAGWLYIRLELDKIETLIANERNTYIQEMYDCVVKNGNKQLGKTSNAKSNSKKR